MLDTANIETDDLDDVEENPEACPGCGCLPGDGVSEDCDDEEGCGFFKGLDLEAKQHGGFYAKNDAAACPGCGCLPSAGGNPGCSHPEGCGAKKVSP